MALLAHNEWLESILADTSSDALRRQGHPEQAGIAQGRLLGAPRARSTRSPSRSTRRRCATRSFPVYRTVRIAAGGLIGGEILKCSLKSIDVEELRGDLHPRRRSAV